MVSALTGGAPGPYALQAAIAAVHDEAATVETTDWPQIVGLYDVLRETAPSPVVELNRAVAVAMVDGPDAGFALLDDLAAAGAWTSITCSTPHGAGCSTGSAGPRGRGGLPEGARRGR